MTDFNDSLKLLKFRNCKRCGKLFSTALSYMVCPSCMQEEEGNYTRIKEFIEANPTATQEEVLQNCGVSQEEFTKFIRGEKIILPEISPISYPCESCGAQIKRGHFCLSCKLQLNRRTFR